MTDKLKEKLSHTAWQVTQEQGTEPPFSGEYNDFNDKGDYHCICCDSYLFSADCKFHSGCGWPAFFQSIDNSINEKPDFSHGMSRIEVACKNCDAHLGHKFPDGPQGTRYCINSVALQFYASKEVSTDE